MSLPVEFTLEALSDLDDLVAIARQLTREAELGRIACGQDDPLTRELVVGEKRLFYRLEAEQILVLGAEDHVPVRH